MSSEEREEWFFGLLAAAKNTSSTQALLACQDVRGWGLIHLAAASGDVKCVEALLNEGARVDELNDDGWTPSMLAAQNGEAGSLAALLKAGADPHVNKGESLTLTHFAIGSYAHDCLDLLISYGVDIHQRDQSDGETLCMLACHKNNSQGLETLMKAGALVDVKNKQGATALMMAAKKGAVECLEMILATGVKVEEQDQDGKMALDYAVASRREASASHYASRLDHVIARLASIMEKTILDGAAIQGANDKARPSMRV